MNSLIGQLFSCENPNYTPDGRPTFVILGVETIEQYFNNWYMRNLTPVVKNLLILNVGIFLLQGLFPLQIERALMLYDFRYEGFMPFQLFTHMFLHGGLMHLFFNMLWLYFMGPLMEQ